MDRNHDHDQSNRGGSHFPPPRRERFQNPDLDFIWPLIEQLDEQALVALQEELAAAVALAATPASPQKAARLRAVAALRKAAEDLGHSPTVDEYRSWRSTSANRRYPPDGTIRSWFGSWNDSLRRARLAPVANGDASVIQNGPRFTAEEAIAAIRECAEEIKHVPSLHEYLRWTKRDTVRRRPGRRPRSQGPFEALFGGWINALNAAGVIDATTAVAVPRTNQVRAAKYFYEDGDLVAGLRQVAERVGRSPRVAEYMNERLKLIDESSTSGILKTIPSYQTFYDRFESWDEALVFAGLEPLGGRSTTSVPRRRPRRTHRITDETILEAIREAYGVKGEPFNSAAYKQWREEELARCREERRYRVIPHYTSVWSRFRTWANARRQALGD